LIGTQVRICPVYPHAPIIEALLDIRAQLPKEVDLAHLEKFQAPVRDRFPEKNKEFP
jgi:uncharacterized protein (TIGR04255 family)